MKSHWFGAACAGALGVFASSAALAAPPPPAAYVPQGTLSGDYSYSSFRGGGHLNSYGGQAGAVLPFGTSDFSGQVDGAYHRLTGAGGSLNIWGVGGALTWHSDVARVGLNVSDTELNAPGNHLRFISYGAYGEWYAGDQFTLGLKGGAVSTSGGGIGGSGNTTLGYVGGQVIGYLTPDFALSGTVDYVGNNTGHVTSAGARAEWLFSREFPVSGFVGYDYNDLSGLRSNSFSVGLVAYLGAPGAPLVAHHRTGVDSWGPTATGLRLAF